MQMQAKGTKALEIRQLTCEDCGAVHDRDVNAGGTFSAWDVRRLQKEAPSGPFSVGRRGRHCFTRITVGQSTSSSSSTHSSLRAAAYHSCQAGSAIMLWM
jgi:hypothetical protein